MRLKNTHAVINALLVYGEAARNDDLDLDGKTIRDDMEILAEILGSPSVAQKTPPLGVRKKRDSPDV